MASSRGHPETLLAAHGLALLVEMQPSDVMSGLAHPNFIVVIGKATRREHTQRRQSLLMRHSGCRQRKVKALANTHGLERTRPFEFNGRFSSSSSISISISTRKHAVRHHPNPRDVTSFLSHRCRKLHKGKISMSSFSHSVDASKQTRLGTSTCSSAFSHMASDPRATHTVRVPHVWDFPGKKICFLESHRVAIFYSFIWYY